MPKLATRYRYQYICAHSNGFMTISHALIRLNYFISLLSFPTSIAYMFLSVEISYRRSSYSTYPVPTLYK